MLDLSTHTRHKTRNHWIWSNKEVTWHNILKQLVVEKKAQPAFVFTKALAFLPSTSQLSDRTALLSLGIACAVFCWTPLRKYLLVSPERTAFVLTAAMFVIYGLARAAGPEEGPSLRFAAL